MTGPILNPPRSYDTITELFSSTGEPLPAPVLVILNPDACESCGGPALPLPQGGRTLCPICTDQIISDLFNDRWPPDQKEVLP